MILSVAFCEIRPALLQPDLDVDSVADLIQQLHIDYSTRAYRREPEFPVDDELIDAACGFVQAAVEARH